MAREHGTLAKLALRYRQFTTLERQIAELRGLVAGEDRELRDLAEAELPDLEARRETEWDELLELCSGDEDADRTRCIVELRAGTGGDEAALFVRDLYEMYGRFGAELGWAVDAVCCIYPCVPLITAQDLQQGYATLRANEDCFAFPVAAFPSAIQRALRREASGKTLPFYPEFALTRTQDLTGLL